MRSARSWSRSQACGKPQASVFSAAPLMPSAVRVQLVSPTMRLPVRPGWIYEPKLDGCRVLLGKCSDVVQVRVRGGALVQRSLQEVTASLARLPAKHVLLDGELVVVNAAGETDFDGACDRLHSAEGPAATVYIFDLLALDGEDLRPRPLRERKAQLAALLGDGDDVLRPVHSIEGTPEPLVESVRELGLEGVVAKYSGAPYQGGRTSLWQKLILRRPTTGWRVEEANRARRR
jgi:bifunctional non-homologous end joining protein LigD